MPELLSAPLGDQEFPFRDLLDPDSQIKWTNFVNDADTNQEGALINQERHFINILGLNTISTADAVRRKAIDLRLQAEEGGLKIEEINALRWALEKTNDCQNADQFLNFLLSFNTFD